MTFLFDFSRLTDTTLFRLLGFTIYNFYWFIHKIEFVIEPKLFHWNDEGFVRYAFLHIRNVERSVDITEFFKKLKCVCHWTDPFKDLKWSNVPGLSFPRFSNRMTPFRACKRCRVCTIFSVVSWIIFGLKIEFVIEPKLFHWNDEGFVRYAFLHIRNVERSVDIIEFFRKLNLQALSNLYYLFGGFMDYLWSRELNISNFSPADW
nr:hypothetical protein [Tanacetum cinerariifolium]